MNEKLVHFLLVEDDDNHARLIIRSLEHARIRNQVERVADGEQALKYLNQEAPFADKKRPDVVLLDLKLPKIDGHEVLKAIKENPEIAFIPVVIMTTSDAEIDLAKAYEHHANSYLVKPIDFDKFRQLVDELSLYWGVWNAPPPKS
jgi:CheY-like chemotaxis protein